jgi:GAF domain-containing protein
VNSEKLAETFVELADSLVDEFDALDLLNVLVERCVDLLGVSAAGLLFADGQDQLRLTVSSSESARLLDLYQLQNDEGPCLECYRSGQPVSAPRLDEVNERWPRFADAAMREGLVSVFALPLRLRGRVIGALNLFGTTAGALDDGMTRVAQAMADVATIAILQERLGKQRELLNEQLQAALDSRVVIEQAKGVLAAHLGVEVEEAFHLMRQRSRSERRRLIVVATEVVAARREALIAVYGSQR